MEGISSTAFLGTGCWRIPDLPRKQLDKDLPEALPRYSELPQWLAINEAALRDHPHDFLLTENNDLLLGHPLVRLLFIPLARLGAHFEEYRDYLRKDKDARRQETVVASFLLEALEAQPEYWGALATLNTVSSPKPRSFGQYLADWASCTPARYQPFIQQIATMFDIELPTLASKTTTSSQNDVSSGH